MNDAKPLVDLNRPQDAAPSGAAAADVQVQAIPADAARRAWIAAGIAWGLGLAALLLIFRDTAEAMALTWWHSSTYQHCMLIPVIAAFLVYERRSLFARTTPKAAPLALLLVLLGGFGWLIGRLTSALIVEELALVFMIQASVALIFGWHVTRALVFPLFFLYFAVPFGDFLIQPLQKVTADMSVWLLHLIGIPTFREGMFISTPSGDFHVAEACSGARFLIAMLPLGVLFANMSFQSPLRRAAVILLSVVVPIVANGIRAFGIIYIAYLTDNEYAVGVDHLVYGWIFFAFVTVVLIAIGMLFADKPREAPAADFSRVPRPAALSTPALVGILAGAVALQALGFAVAGERMLTPPETGPIAFEMPEVGGGWEPVENPSPAWRPSFPTAAFQEAWEYRNAAGQQVTLYFAWYPYQRQGASLIQFGNTLTPGRWTWHDAKARKVTLNGRSFTVNESLIGDLRVQRRVWSWYWIGGQVTANDYLAKLAHLWALLSSGEESASIIAISTELGHRPEEVSEVMADFFANARSNLPGFPSPERATE